MIVKSFHQIFSNIESINSKSSPRANDCSDIEKDLIKQVQIDIWQAHIQK